LNEKEWTWIKVFFSDPKREKWAFYINEIIFLNQKTTTMKDFSKIAIAASAGLIAGAVLGVLFAPAKGERTREDITKKTKKLFREINEQGSEKLGELKEKFEDQLGKINEKIREFAGVS